MSYSFDSFLVLMPVCDNICIRESRIYQGKTYRSYCKAKRGYYYGVKLFLLTRAKCEPAQAFLMPESPGPPILLLPSICRRMAPRSISDVHAKA
ncbi:MAG TPA: hypothetical protein VM532_07635 [Burkholderiales bacterium]|nr:hypothetical protein [Burkholderiales bacterium]